jgi:DNA polymerase III sliding clamp (beta) subunit (PCNA family)
MLVTAVVSEAGAVQVEREIAWEHEPFEFLISPAVMLQALRSIKSDYVRLELESDALPILMRDLRDDGHTSYTVYATVRR